MSLLSPGLLHHLAEVVYSSTDFWLILTEPPACVRGVEPAFAVGKREGRQGFDPPEECKATS